MLLIYIGCKSLVVTRKTISIIRVGLSGGASVVKYMEVSL